MDFAEDTLSSEVIILVHGLGGNLASTRSPRDFFVSHGFSVIRISLPGTSLHDDAAAINEAVQYASVKAGYQRISLVAKSLGGVATLLSKGAKQVVLWDPSLDLKWLASKTHIKKGEHYLRNHRIPQKMVEEFMVLDPVSLLRGEQVILAGCGPYAGYAKQIGAAVIAGANHKFTGYEEELYSLTLRLLHRKEGL